MHLKPSIEITEFLKAVNTCKNDVLFETPEGDQMNLKSELCRIVFATTPHHAVHGDITCKNPDDLAILKDYLED